MPGVPIIDLTPAAAAAAAAADQNEPEPPQRMAPPTAFTAKVFDQVDKLEAKEVRNIAQVIDAAAVEAEPLLKRELRLATSRCRRFQHRREGQECRQRRAGHTEWILARRKMPHHPMRKAL